MTKQLFCEICVLLRQIGQQGGGKTQRFATDYEYEFLGICVSRNLFIPFS